MFAEWRGVTPVMTTIEPFFIIQICGIKKGISNIKKEKFIISRMLGNVEIPINTLTESTSKHFAGLIIVTKPNLSTIVILE